MMRRMFQDKEFKGSVFVEFSTVEEATKVLENKDLKYKDEVLIKMLKYVAVIYVSQPFPY
jgi:hypothetical protein